MIMPCGVLGYTHTLKAIELPCVPSLERGHHRGSQDTSQGRQAGPNTTLTSGSFLFPLGTHISENLWPGEPETHTPQRHNLSSEMPAVGIGVDTSPRLYIWLWE